MHKHKPTRRAIKHSLQFNNMGIFVNGKEHKVFVNGKQMAGYVNGVKMFGQTVPDNRFLISSGNNYIPLDGFTFLPSDEIDFEFFTQSAQSIQVVMSVRQQHGFFARVDTPHVQFRYGGSILYGGSLATADVLNKVLWVRMNATVCECGLRGSVIPLLSIASTAWRLSTLTYPMLFARYMQYDEYTSYFLQGGINKFQVKNALTNELRLDMYPVGAGSTQYSSIPAPSTCMWDTVSQRYFENAGSGEFTIGTIV